jgi:hypothetical protein
MAQKLQTPEADRTGEVRAISPLARAFIARNIARAGGDASRLRLIYRKYFEKRQPRNTAAA